MNLSIIWDIKPENVMFGGVYYHHKIIEDDSLTRVEIREKQNAEDNGKTYAPKSTKMNLGNIASQSKKMAFDRLFTLKDTTNPFTNLESSLASDEEFIFDYLYSDTIVILPFNGTLADDYKELNDRTPLSLIVLTASDVHVGFFTPKKFLKEYIDKRLKKV